MHHVSRFSSCSTLIASWFMCMLDYHSVPSLCLAGDLCCMSHSLTSYFSLSNYLTKAKKQIRYLQQQHGETEILRYFTFAMLTSWTATCRFVLCERFCNLAQFLCRREACLRHSRDHILTEFVPVGLAG